MALDSLQRISRFFSLVNRNTPDVIIYFVVLSGNVGAVVPTLGQWKERGFGERIDVLLQIRPALSSSLPIVAYYNYDGGWVCFALHR